MKEMKYKLIALDVDGTLLNDNYELTKPTKETIRLVHDAGGQIVLCTGRGPSNTLPLLLELGMEGTVITHNGAATVHSSGPKLLSQYAFSWKEIEPFVAYCHEQDVHFDICTAFELFVTVNEREQELGDAEKAMYEKFLITPVFVNHPSDIIEPIVKMTVFGTKALMDRVEKDWSAQPLSSSLRIIRSGDYFIDVMHQHATKGNALKLLAESWSIDASQVVAIGNYFNDLEMMNFAGLGIAMANSPLQVKQAADKVTLSNNEDGVHVALREYCLA